MPKVIAFVPARAGSERVPNKNIKPLGGHPLIAYAITNALQSGVFDKVVVSTDLELIRDIAIYYGAQVPFLRPAEFASSTSPDIEWIKHAFSQLKEQFDIFSILRSTSPFRSVEMIQRAWKQFLNLTQVDSLRAVELCKQHPGKMWIIEGEVMKPLLDQSHLDVTWYAGQYQALPKVYIQNSSLEIAWVRVVKETNSREGRIVAPFFTNKIEGFSIDYEDDFNLAEHLVKTGKAVLPRIERKPFKLN